MEQKVVVRKTILIELDVALSDENEDYLEAEITHPRLSGALYLTVNSRKELEDELNKVDLTGTEEEPEQKPYVVSHMPSLSTQNSTPPTRQTSNTAGRSLDSLIRDSYDFASKIIDLRVRIKKK